MKTSFAKHIFILAIALLLPSGVFAGTEHSMSGWAWSDNIGWISFNSTNCDTDSNGFIDSSCSGGDNATTVVKDYGVNVNSNGNLQGYAWSDNVGWILFGNLARYGYFFPTGNGTLPRDASIDAEGNMLGWAKAISADNKGWDGWISLSGTWTNPNDNTTGTYGVNIGDTTSPFVTASAENKTNDILTWVTKLLDTNVAYAEGSTSQGFAWGSDVTGWIDFSGVTNSDLSVADLTFYPEPTYVSQSDPNTTLKWRGNDLKDCTASSNDSSSGWGGSIVVTSTTSSQAVSVPSNPTGYTLSCNDLSGNPVPPQTIFVAITPNNNNGGGTPPPNVPICDPTADSPTYFFGGNSCTDDPSTPCADGYSGENAGSGCTRRAPHFQNK